MANNIKLYRGVTYPTSYQHTDGNGAKLSLVGCTVIMTIKKAKYDDKADDSTAPFKVAVTSHTDAPNGLTNWETLFPAIGFPPGKYFYDIVVKNAAGKEAPPVLIGECQVLGKRTNI